MKVSTFLKRAILPVTAAFMLAGCGSSDSASGSKENVLEKIEEEKVITWGVKNDTRLFGLMNTETNEVEGFDIDLARALTKEMFGEDTEVKLKEVTSKTRIQLLNGSDIDAIIATMTITDERKKEVDFSDVYFDAGQSLLVKKGSDITGVDSLGGKTVLAVKGSTSAINIREKAPEAEVLEFENYAEAFTALKQGNGDALTTDDSILYGMADEDPSFELVGGQFTEEPYGIAIKKGNEDFVEKVNEALKALKDSGEYDEIKDKWIKAN
ncbi:transporter substrate-binding domain-containing protein [Cytobacillus horneckiae]|uniref:Amino acid ABC transporter substrate-binding protein n=1 Tax=Cytobacillus horneckiae TaxID=549687 RepID=A0A2N0ZBB5_9BACI|nr:transporter substrate-binding domain-containing protein [Cytobacillus horneckiae]MEC1158526.1 transporter substrate-binding domain-containing protein [Cytobacillus horneckiae]MED2939629.1 transporter substrate-binding domain-containing protein [Cytobacillus horneckiae]PKG26806.1 amino acid ABC transporter substrate-binding protein [Cytobacillus horneckiae]